VNKIKDFSITLDAKSRGTFQNRVIVAKTFKSWSDIWFVSSTANIYWEPSNYV